MSAAWLLLDFSNDACILDLIYWGDFRKLFGVKHFSISTAKLAFLVGAPTAFSWLFTQQFPIYREFFLMIFLMSFSNHFSARGSLSATFGILLAVVYLALYAATYVEQSQPVFNKFGLELTFLGLAYIIISGFFDAWKAHIVEEKPALNSLNYERKWHQDVE